MGQEKDVYVSKANQSFEFVWKRQNSKPGVTFPYKMEK